jgi:hypothetical protein
MNLGVDGVDYQPDSRIGEMIDLSNNSDPRTLTTHHKTMYLSFLGTICAIQGKTHSDTLLNTERSPRRNQNSAPSNDDCPARPR